MLDDLQEMATATTALAEVLPHSVMVALATIIRPSGVKGWSWRQMILQNLPTPTFRDAAGDFLDAWNRRFASVGSESVAVSLLTAATSHAAHRGAESVEIVWTGPEPGDFHFRQTEQAILEVINSAKQRLTVVSYAVYRIPRIGEALIAAANRGVAIRLVVETPNRIEGQNEYDCVRALGQDVASAASVYYWPQANRARDDNGKIGILHVKCALADGRLLFLSSANFTEYAFTINMELGLLISSGKLPAQIERHFDQLVETEILLRV